MIDTPRAVVFDVDGVLTDGSFTYTNRGKVSKVFGPHDADALKILAQYFQIEFISADKRGFDITRRRVVSDMGYRLTLVGESWRARVDYLNLHYQLNCVFMADGFLDAPALAQSTYAIVPKNGHPYALAAADYITSAGGGQGAVADACDHLMKMFRFRNLLGEEVPL